MVTAPHATASGKPGEFMASGGSPPGAPPAIELLEEELAEIIAEALAADIQQFPVLEAIQGVTASTANSPRGSASRKPPSSRARANRLALACDTSSG
jgi:hypothetical protein